MREALGGYFNISILFFFILLVSGFISLSINYTKAYRVKNNVLTYLEKYEGNPNNEELLDYTSSYIQSVGYNASNESISAAKNAGYTCSLYKGQEQGWCYKKNSPNGDRFSIDIVVFVSVDIPVLNKVFANFKFFWLNGTTSSIPIME